MRMLAIFLLCLAFAGMAYAHSVVLTWTATTSVGIQQYNIYRAQCAPTDPLCLSASYAAIDTMPAAATSYTDVNVGDGAVYSYYVTAQCPSAGCSDGSTGESVGSNFATAVIPATAPSPVPAPNGGNVSPNSGSGNAAPVTGGGAVQPAVQPPKP